MALNFNRTAFLLVFTILCLQTPLLRAGRLPQLHRRGGPGVRLPTVLGFGGFSQAGGRRSLQDQLAAGTSAAGSGLSQGSDSDYKQPLALFCNATGPCTQCAPANANTKADQDQQCQATGFRQEMVCLVDREDAQPPHEFKKDLSVTGNEAGIGKVFTSFYSCSADTNEFSVVAFEWFVVIMLLVSGSVVTWRKRMARLL